MVCLRTDLSTHFQMLWTQIKNVECKLMQFVRVIQIISLRGEKPRYKPIPKISSCKLLSCFRRSDSGVQRRREEGKNVEERERGGNACEISFQKGHSAHYCQLIIRT